MTPCSGTTWDILMCDCLSCMNNWSLGCLPQRWGIHLFHGRYSNQVAAIGHRQTLLKSGSGKDCHHQESWDSFTVSSALFLPRCIFFPVDKPASVWAWVAMMWDVDDLLIHHSAACYKDWPSIRATHITLTAFVHEVCDQAFWKSWQFAVALRSLLDMGGGELILIVQLSEYERRQRS